MSAIQIKKIATKYPILRAVLYPVIAARRLLQKKNNLLLKEVTNNLSEILIGDPIIRVDEFEGVFAVDIRSDLFSRIVLNRHYEPQLAQLCRRYLDKNRDAIDVGANIGFYTVMFAKNLAQQKVLSIEPAKSTLQRLQRNVALNGVMHKVEVFEGVASNRNGAVEIKTIKGKEEYSSLGAMDHPSITKEKWALEEVMGATLDELVKQKSLDPGFLKVDVEGVEHLVFTGAKKVLSEKRPVILSELSDFLLKRNGSSAREVIDLIKSHGYDVFDPINPSIQPGAKDFGDILCVPQERRERINTRQGALSDSESAALHCRR